jgi:hypothetical protein
MSSYYKTYLTTKEREFVDKITDIALEKLFLTDREFITLKEIEGAFNETFSTYTSDDQIYEIFDECATAVLTRSGGFVYNFIHHREKGTKEELRERIKNSIAFELKRYLSYYEKNSSTTEKAIRKYVDSRKYDGLVTRVPELEGLF